MNTKEVQRLPDELPRICKNCMYCTSRLFKAPQCYAPQNRYNTTDLVTGKVTVHYITSDCREAREWALCCGRKGDWFCEKTS